MSSYKVRIWSILTNTRSKKPTYTVRWLVADEPFRETFATRAAAESFRSKLLVAQREGVAFDEELGLPEPMARELRKTDQISWYQHAIAYVDMKWPRSSARERKSVADALATVTPALLINDPGIPSPELTRAALYGWAFNKARRRTEDPPEHLAEALGWLQAHTVPLEQLMDPVTIRTALDAITVKGDGTAAGRCCS